MNSPKNKKNKTKHYSAELSLVFQKVEFISKCLSLDKAKLQHQFWHNFYELSERVLLTSLFFSGLELSGVEPEPYFWFR